MDRSSNSSVDNEDKYRTPWSILFNCVSTIVLCIWLAIHPNVLYSDFYPYSKNGKDVSIRGRLLFPIRKSWNSFIYRLPIFIVALIYPEFIYSWAVQQRVSARYLALQNGWKITQAHFMLMGGFHLFDQQGGPLRPLTLTDINDMIHRGRLELPTREEIHDRGKSTTLITWIALMQIVWYSLSCSVRAVQSIQLGQSLPLTKLDVVTIFYMAASFSIYMAWWDKPRNVPNPIRICQTSSRILPLSQPRFLSTLSSATVMQLIQVAFGFRDDAFRLRHEGRIPRFYAGHFYYAHDKTSLVMAFFLGAISTGIHCIAWSFGSSSLSSTEMTLWRICSLAFWFFSFSSFFTMMTLEMARSAKLPQWLINSLGVVIITFAVIYIISRIALLILALMALRYIPPAYRPIYWTDLIPHI